MRRTWALNTPVKPDINNHQLEGINEEQLIATPLNPIDQSS